MKKDIVTMAIDLCHNSVGEYSAEDVNSNLRKAFLGIAGVENIDYKAFRRCKPELFEVIEEALDVLIVEGLESQFDEFVEIKNTAWGDTNVFNIDDHQLFDVAVIANGTGNLRRQRLDRGSIPVETGMYGIKIYEELYRFLAGRIDWTKMVEKVSLSYNNKIANDIYAAIYNSYSVLGSTYGVSGNFSETVLKNLISHVEAATGVEAEILGTKASLSKITTAVTSEKAKEAMNATGYFGVFNGTSMRAIKQAHKAGTDDFIINDSFVMVIPKLANKMIKLVIEGDAIIQDTPGGVSADMSLEHTFLKSAGIAVVSSSKYGIYRID